MRFPVWKCCGATPDARCGVRFCEVVAEAAGVIAHSGNWRAEQVLYPCAGCVGCGAEGERKNNREISDLQRGDRRLHYRARDCGTCVHVPGTGSRQGRIRIHRQREGGGERGWMGDVAFNRLITERIRGLGWRCQRTSRQGLREAMMPLIEDAELL